MSALWIKKSGAAETHRLAQAVKRRKPAVT